MPATYENESYAGIIEALNQVALYNGREIQSYDPNFNGIIAAILNLGQLGDASLGEYPPFWEVETDEDGNIIGGDFTRPPVNGDLWFDTRQGRLMVYVDDAYYQTNGADVLTTVSTNQPTTEVVGALWYNPTTGSLFVYDGIVWNNITSSTFSTTQLPLSTPAINRSYSINEDVKIIDEYTPDTNFTQATLNLWVLKALGQLDARAYANSVSSQVRETYAGSNAPTSPQEGYVWYDTTIGALKVFNNNTWKVATDLTDINSSLLSLEESHDNCQANNVARFNAIESSISALPFGNYATTDSVTAGDQALSDSIIALENTVGNLDRFKLKAAANLEHVAIEHRISLLENDPGPDLSNYTTSEQLNAGLASLASTISEFDYAPKSYVETKISEVQIPDISGKLDKSVYDQHVSEADSTYIKRTGGTINGSLVLDYTDIDATTLDFSSSFASGIKAIGLKAKNATAPATFGTTSEPLEIAWKFTGNEDFKWKHGTKDVLKVNKNGVSTPALFVNGINVETKLAELQARPSGGSTVDLSPLEAKIASLESNVSTMSVPNISGLEQAVLDLQTKVNSGLCTNQIYYQDTAPTNVHDGDIWFNSCTLRLYVRHSNAWINPDRVVDETPEPTPAPTVDLSTIHTQLGALQSQVASLTGSDLNLKVDLFNAVATSVSFLDLKNKLMAALSG